MLEKTIKELEKGLPPNVVSKRKQAGRELSYIEGHYAIDTANRIFGYEGWQMAIKQLDLYDTDKGYEAVAVVQLKVADADGDIVRTDVGTGDSSIKMGRDKAVKEAVNAYTDINPYVGGDKPSSDHAPFEARGFEACLLIEFKVWTNPHYHKATDAVDTDDYIDYEYATKMTRAAVGYLATQAGFVPEPTVVFVFAIGVVALLVVRGRRRLGT